MMSVKDDGCPYLRLVVTAPVPENFLTFVIRASYVFSDFCLKMRFLVKKCDFFTIKIQFFAKLNYRLCLENFFVEKMPIFHQLQYTPPFRVATPLVKRGTSSILVSKILNFHPLTMDKAHSSYYQKLVCTYKHYRFI
jgi:hypothetical protein